MVRKIASAEIAVSLKMIVAVLVAVMLVQTSQKAYDFGLQIFHPEPVSQQPGKDIIVIVEEKDSDLEVAKRLESKGLILDAYVFFIQAKLYKADLYAGTYTLNTSMTSEEMLKLISEKPVTS
ncbi:MAG: aminodeoxychorismate lyase [Lachnospiraceae bacterium]|nr:aminodeoxychorismate lyase [Lachnospiraceae bacterium]